MPGQTGPTASCDSSWAALRPKNSNAARRCAIREAERQRPSSTAVLRQSAQRIRRSRSVPVAVPAAGRRSLNTGRSRRAHCQQQQVPPRCHPRQQQQRRHRVTSILMRQRQRRCLQPCAAAAPARTFSRQQWVPGPAPGRIRRQQMAHLCQPCHGDCTSRVCESAQQSHEIRHPTTQSTLHMHHVSEIPRQCAVDRVHCASKQGHTWLQQVGLPSQSGRLHRCRRLATSSPSAKGGIPVQKARANRGMHMPSLAAAHVSHPTVQW